MEDQKERLTAVISTGELERRWKDAFRDDYQHHPCRIPCPLPKNQITSIP
jgi:hypothetical protein